MSGVYGFVRETCLPTLTRGNLVRPLHVRPVQAAKWSSAHDYNDGGEVAGPYAGCNDKNGARSRGLRPN